MQNLFTLSHAKREREFAQETQRLDVASLSGGCAVPTLRTQLQTSGTNCGNTLSSPRKCLHQWPTTQNKKDARRNCFCQAQVLLFSRSALCPCNREIPAERVGCLYVICAADAPVLQNKFLWFPPHSLHMRFSVSKRSSVSSSS